MSSNISDCSMLKIKNNLQNEHKIKKLDEKLKRCVYKIINDRKIKNGQGIISWFLVFLSEIMVEMYKSINEKKLSIQYDITRLNDQ